MELNLLSGLLCLRCPGLQWSGGGEDQQSAGQNEIQPVSEDEQHQVHRVENVSVLFVFWVNYSDLPHRSREKGR